MGSVPDVNKVSNLLNSFFKIYIFCVCIQLLIFTVNSSCRFSFHKLGQDSTILNIMMINLVFENWASSCRSSTQMWQTQFRQKMANQVFALAFDCAKAAFWISDTSRDFQRSVDTRWGITVEHLFCLRSLVQLWWIVKVLLNFYQKENRTTTCS